MEGLFGGEIGVLLGVLKKFVHTGDSVIELMGESVLNQGQGRGGQDGVRAYLKKLMDRTGNAVFVNFRRRKRQCGLLGLLASDCFLLAGFRLFGGKFLLGRFLRRKKLFDLGLRNELLMFLSGEVHYVYLHVLIKLN